MSPPGAGARPDRREAIDSQPAHNRFPGEGRFWGVDAVRGGGADDHGSIAGPETGGDRQAVDHRRRVVNAGRRTTTRCTSAFTAPFSGRAGTWPSAAGTSPRSISSGPKQMHGSCTTTTDGRTTGTTGTTGTSCGAEPRSTSSTASTKATEHDHHHREPQSPSVPSALGPEEPDSPGRGAHRGTCNRRDETHGCLVRRAEFTGTEGAGLLTVQHWAAVDGATAVGVRRRQVAVTPLLQRWVPISPGRRISVGRARMSALSADAEPRQYTVGQRGFTQRPPTGRRSVVPT